MGKDCTNPGNQLLLYCHVKTTNFGAQVRDLPGSGKETDKKIIAFVIEQYTYETYINMYNGYIV